MSTETLNWLEVVAERDRLREHLTSVQVECTKLLLENRTLKERAGLSGAAAQVREFHTQFGVQIMETPTVPDEMRQGLRKRLITEECLEFLTAWEKRDLVEIADGIADLIYVLLGTALSYGIPIGDVFNEVHRTNMLKVKGSVRDDGKILKPEGWQPPNIAGILEAAKVNAHRLNVPRDEQREVRRMARWVLGVVAVWAGVIWVFTK